MIRVCVTSMPLMAHLTPLRGMSPAIDNNVDWMFMLACMFGNMSFICLRSSSSTLAIAAELIRRKIDVTFAAFDTIIDRDNHVNIRQVLLNSADDFLTYTPPQVLPPDMQIIPLGEVDPGFGPYAATEVCKHWVI